MPKILHLDAPANFSFRHTINSHGWCELLPFETDHEKQLTNYVFTDENAQNPTTAQISTSGGRLRIEIFGGKVNEKFEEKILRDVRHILRLDDNFAEFYAVLKAANSLVWIAEQNVGRLLRSPTVYEDLVKTICTTNCSWALTKKMTANLAEKLGTKTADGKSAFPTAEAMAGVPVEFYRDEIRAGYRSAYFAELAARVAAGEINPESWLDADLPTAELKKQMKQIKGVGDYAAENLLKLVGHYDGLALDSWLRAQFYKKHNGGEVCADKNIEDFYAKFDRWRGLAIWCDMTERWFD